MNSARMSVKTRLTLAFGGLIAILLAVATFSIVSLSDANQRLERLVEGTNALSQAAAEVRFAVDRRAIAARNLVLVSKQQDLAQEEQRVTAAHRDVRERLALLMSQVDRVALADPQSRTLLQELERIEQAYGPVALAIVALARDGKHDAAIAKMNDECRPLLQSLLDASDRFVAHMAEQVRHALDDARGSYAARRALLLVICVLTVAAASVAGALIVSGLMRALGTEPDALGDAARRVADGNLSPIPGAERAAPGSVLSTLAGMQASLAEVVGRVREASGAIATGSAQISSGNADLSQRTEKTASNLQETASSMEQLSSMVKATADSAREANGLASDASAAASRGGEVVSEVITTMQSIAASSRKISDIIGVIDGIAFQTNILALNAAVEAARAGEQGRGFAVVAGEVRLLAQRCADAAREIKALIVDSTKQVDGGARLVEAAGATMTDIVAQVQRVGTLIGEITQATGEQSGGIDQVALAVNELDSATQQNASLVEQNAAAADSLRQQSAELAQMVEHFKL